MHPAAAVQIPPAGAIQYRSTSGSTKAVALAGSR